MPHGFFEQIDYIETVIKKAEYFHLAFSTQDQPYVVPLNFGYAEGVFYVHSKPNGTKLDLLAHNPKVAFSLLTNVETLHDEEQPENCSMRYMSVMGEGSAERVQDLAEKRRALDVISAQYNLPACNYEIPLLQSIAVIKITPHKMTGKWGTVDCDRYFETIH